MRFIVQTTVLFFLTVFIFSFQPPSAKWESKFIKVDKAGLLKYIPDEKGNIIPDFSRVGYYSGDLPVPNVQVVKTIRPNPNGNSENIIQSAIDEISKRKPGKDGFRGAILLKKGIYRIAEDIRIGASGIVLRGEGNDSNGTRLVALSKKQVSLVNVSGKGNITEIKGTRVKITDTYVAVGSFSFNVSSASGFKKGDRIILFRPGTGQWIKDLKMDQIEDRGGTQQWQDKEYNLQFERVITKVENKKIFIDNPVVMPIETIYGGGEIYKYSFDGRISKVGIENIYLESEFETDTSENHAWDAIAFNRIEQGWIRNVNAKYFGFSCVNLGSLAKNISVLNSGCFDHKSVITGSRRYSFNNNGQLNLFMNCRTTDGRHDYVTGARTLGPNVFYNCTASKTHADIGPHHRWSAGTLYDNITTDGEINVQDRGNWGSGHGWAGVTQIIWNCSVKRAAIQNPWVSGKNYCIGMKGEKYDGRLPGRPDGEWEGQNQEGLQPVSLYLVQLKARRK
jgi:hypothetical protein